MKTLEEKIKVMQAFLDGKEIKLKNLTIDNPYWLEALSPTWDWDTFDYEIRPEWKPKKFDWVYARNQGDVRWEMVMYFSEMNDEYFCIEYDPEYELVYGKPQTGTLELTPFKEIIPLTKVI